jgi:hypothetical protein
MKTPVATLEPPTKTPWINGERLGTTEDLGAVLLVSSDVVRRKIRSKAWPIPHLVVGSQLRFVGPQVTSWLADLAAKGGSLACEEPR